MVKGNEMKEYAAKSNPRCPTHLGELLREEILQPSGLAGRRWRRRWGFVTPVASAYPSPLRMPSLARCEMPMAMTPPQTSAIPSSCTGGGCSCSTSIAPMAVNSGPVPRATG
jgi:hypothetical protein